MITGLVMVGKGVVGLMVCTPEPGMLKVIVFVPVRLFAKVIASRSEFTQSLALVSSAVVVTTSGLTRTMLNSLVSLVPKSVAVVLTLVTTVEVVKLNDALPLASVVTLTAPKKNRPCPKQLGSGTLLSKSSMLKL